MKQSKIVLATLFLMICATAGEAALKFGCNAGGRVFSVTAGSSPLDVVSMWNKSASDIDIGIFDSNAETIGLGLGIVNRFESVSVGVLPGLEYSIVILKAVGPNSPCLVHIGEQFPFSAASATAPRDLGNLRNLAQTDERYARILEVMREHAAGKRRQTR